jgi:hypothetical protein
MHRHHLLVCGFGIAAALAVVALAGGSAGSLGVLAALLICPLIMIGALLLLTRQPASPTPPPAGRDAEHEHQVSAR